jgi:hypothetical protein
MKFSTNGTASPPRRMQDQAWQLQVHAQQIATLQEEMWDLQQVVAALLLLLCPMLNPIVFIGQVLNKPTKT